LPPSAKGESKIKTHHKHVRKKYTSPGASARAFAVSIGFVHQQEGSQRFTLASFREPLAAWKIAVRVFGIACLLYGLVEEIRYGKSNSWTPLFGLACLQLCFTPSRYVRFYEKGLSISKAACSVFLSREQLLEMKLDGDRFIVTGPDANRGGPYSGGIFQIRPKDLRNFQDVLVRFQYSLRGNEVPPSAGGLISRVRP
jgi:hypothetical protein